MSRAVLGPDRGEDAPALPISKMHQDEAVVHFATPQLESHP
jgi:hypothetical protein